MQTIELSQLADPDGKLRLEIPVAKAGIEYRVLVSVAEADARQGASRWPPGYFERTAGRWVGELELPAPLTLETRRPL